MKQALIAIDIQESFRQRPYWNEADLPAFIDATQHLVSTCVERGIPILQVFHVSEEDTPADPFSLASGHVRPLAELHLEPSAVFHKHVHSALYGRTQESVTLLEWLRRHEIEEVIICGIRTEQCCETTTRHASDDGFKVVYALDATLTFAMQSPSGRVYTPQEIKDRTELVLVDRFAKVVPAAQVFSS